MSLVVSAERILADLASSCPTAEIHECSRGRWQAYKDCEGCRVIASDYMRQRYADRKRARKPFEDLRCPCPSCRARR